MMPVWRLTPKQSRGIRLIIYAMLNHVMPGAKNIDHALGLMLTDADCILLAVANDLHMDTLQCAMELDKHKHALMKAYYEHHNSPLAEPPTIVESILARETDHIIRVSAAINLITSRYNKLLCDHARAERAKKRRIKYGKPIREFPIPK